MINPALTSDKLALNSRLTQALFVKGRQRLLLFQ